MQDENLYLWKIYKRSKPATAIWQIKHFLDWYDVPLTRIVSAFWSEFLDFVIILGRVVKGY